MPTARKSISARGFTLVELMVAISIVVILATIGLTVFSQAQIAARDTRRIGDMQETQKALEQFYAINRSFLPTTTTAMANPTAVNALAALNTYYQNNVPPSDPNTALNGGTPYYYYPYGAPATSYVICARLEVCTGKCNMAFGSVADGSTTLATFGSAPAAHSLYCLKSLSN